MLSGIEGFHLPGHVIAAFLQFDHGPTVITSLPACFFRRLEQAVRLLVLRTVLCPVPFSITQTTNLHLATAAFPNLLPILLMDICRLYPFATPSSWAVYTVLGRIFCEFSVPGLLKFHIK